MKKITKHLKWMTALCIVFILLTSAAVFVYHQDQLRKEAMWLTGKGTMVKVNGGKINVYSEGSGEDTFIFLSGSGIAAPVYEMKGLYSKFSKENSIAVIERGGYGYSDVFSDDRNIEMIVNQTREALLQSGHQPPYIIVPHSLSGIEAIYWAQRYPNEIKAIIALDIGLPHEYADHKLGLTDSFMIRGMSLLTKIGFHRLVPSAVYDPEVIKQSFLTNQEKKEFKAISYKQIFNDNMKQELLRSAENAEKSIALPLPKETPILFLAAYTEENKNSPFTKEGHRNYEKMARQLRHGEVKKVKGKHSLYLYAPDEIYRLATLFLNEQIKEEPAFSSEQERMIK